MAHKYYEQNKIWQINTLLLHSRAYVQQDHILFNCPVSRFIWCIVGRAFSKTVVPRSRDEFTELYLVAGGKQANSITWFWFSAVAWSLWLIRNERVFQHKVLLNPLTPLYRAISLMLQWMPLVVPKRRAATEACVERIRRSVQEVGADQDGDG